MNYGKWNTDNENPVTLGTITIVALGFGALANTTCPQRLPRYLL